VHSRSGQYEILFGVLVPYPSVARFPPAKLNNRRKPRSAGMETFMREPERLDGLVIGTTQARQGVTGHNVRVVLSVSLLLAVTAGVVLVGYFWTHSPSVGG
jgi:hypothetical protein